MKMNLNEYNAYTAVHNGGLYKATIWRTDGEYPFELRVCYVDDAGARHEEFLASLIRLPLPLSGSSSGTSRARAWSGLRTESYQQLAVKLK